MEVSDEAGVRSFLWPGSGGCSLLVEEGAWAQYGRDSPIHAKDTSQMA